MSRSHADILQQLVPVPWMLTDAERVAYGNALDRTKARFDLLQREMLPGTAVDLLPAWEGLYQVVPAAGASIEQRQRAVDAKFKAIGDIKKPYYVKLAAAMGYTIYIRSYITAMADWLCADDELIDDEPWTYLTSGVGLAGDTMAQENPVLPWIWEIVVVSSPVTPPSPGLEEVLLDLAPAHIQFNFTYL
ncbi:DUF2313 domain-containing protein [Geomonas sp. Red32]|uniref:putative phage tail protein n=1 Tax=Geomonas sp. Red32 TaxID=2912856 RepID=UPI00202CE99D|nr:putative phage tail protein [Geomonas sp. Red32]MCM0081768.1 DUF2313 domain-containing protein [Geomonas sp. Red32]